MVRKHWSNWPTVTCAKFWMSFKAHGWHTRTSPRRRFICALVIQHQATSKRSSIGWCRSNRFKNAMKVSMIVVTMNFNGLASPLAVNLKVNCVFFSRKCSEIQNLKTDKGLALEDILREIHLFVMRSKCQWKKRERNPNCLNKLVLFPFSVELPPRVMSCLLIKMAQIEQSLATGCNENPQLSAFVAAFHIARNMIAV